MATRKKLPSGIRRHGSGYQARITIRGRAYWQTKDSLAEAQQWLDEMKGKRAAGIRPSVANQTLGEYLTEWLKNPTRSRKKDRPLAANTISTYRHVERLRDTSLWSVKVRDLEPEAITAAYGELKPGPKGGDPKKAVRYVHDGLSAALESLVRKGRLPKNPARYADRVEHVSEEVNPWTTSEDVKDFLEVASEDRLNAFWRVLVLGGLREGEALGLREEDVDFRLRGVWVRYQFTRENGRAVHKPILKSSRSYRFVSLDAGTLEALRAVMRRTREERLESGPRWHEDEHRRLFRHGPRSGRGGMVVAPGTPVAPSRSLNDRLLALTKKSGLPYIGLHGLRHTHATLLLRNGADVYRVSRRLGHSSVAVTERVYAKWIPGDDREEADLIERLLVQDVSNPDAEFETRRHGTRRNDMNESSGSRRDDTSRLGPLRAASSLGNG